LLRARLASSPGPACAKAQPGMGTAAAKCSDITKGGGLGAPKPLEASTSEEEHEEEGEEEEEDSEEEERAEAEAALQNGLKRGGTSTFKEAIDHATELGVDMELIAKAEAKLEEHKTKRRREAFEAELKDFLKGDESRDLTACAEKLKQGAEYGVSEKALQPIRAKMSDLELNKELSADEVEKAKLFVEVCTRRFVASCLPGREVGRGTTLLDLHTGQKRKVVLKLDLALRDLRVQTPDGEDLHTCKVAGTFVRHASDVEGISSQAGFAKLPEEDVNNALIVMTVEEEPFCIVEDSRIKHDEILCAFAVLSAGKGFTKPPQGLNSTKHGSASQKRPSITNSDKVPPKQSNAESNDNLPQVPGRKSAPPQRSSVSGLEPLPEEPDRRSLRSSGMGKLGSLNEEEMIEDSAPVSPSTEKRKGKGETDPKKSDKKKLPEKKRKSKHKEMEEEDEEAD